MLARLMRLSLVALALALTAVSLPTATAASNVIELNVDNFDSIILSGSRPALVEFYAPWCGHCKQLAPIYEELADAYAAAKDALIIAKVDADTHRALSTRYGIKGFPTLKWFDVDGSGEKKPVDYEGGRELEDFVQFIKEKTGLSAKIVTQPSEVIAVDDTTFDSVVLDPNTNALVEFYAPWCGHCKQLAPIYEKLALAFKGEPACKVVKIDADAHRTVGERYEIAGFPMLKFFKKGDEKVATTKELATPVDFDGPRELTDMLAFLNKQCHTQRTADGHLAANAGVVPEFQALLPADGGLTAAAATSLLVTFEKMAPELLGDPDASVYYQRTVPYYLRVLKKTTEKPDYPAKEAARLGKMISGGTAAMSSEKLDDLYLRFHVLKAVVGGAAAAGSEEAAAAVGHEEL